MAELDCHRGAADCDVKSDNVLLGLDGSVKLGDYGSSREARARDRRGRPTGTVHWMAPEVWGGGVGGIGWGDDTEGDGPTPYFLDFFITNNIFCCF